METTETASSVFRADSSIPTLFDGGEHFRSGQAAKLFGVSQDFFRKNVVRTMKIPTLGDERGEFFRQQDVRNAVPKWVEYRRLVRRGAQARHAGPGTIGHKPPRAEFDSAIHITADDAANYLGTSRPNVLSITKAGGLDRFTDAETGTVFFLRTEIETFKTIRDEQREAMRRVHTERLRTMTPEVRKHLHQRKQEHRTHTHAHTMHTTKPKPRKVKGRVAHRNSLPKAATLVASTATTTDSALVLVAGASDIQKLLAAGVRIELRLPR